MSGVPIWAIWVVAFGLALPGVLPAVSSRALAQNEESIFTVRDVAVDETAATAADARQQALAVGQRRAFHRLMNRLVPEDQQSLIPELDANTLPFYVRDFSVNNEKTSTVRYLAELTVRFKPDEVRNLLRSHDVAFAETLSKPLLILPVFDDPQAGPILWQDPNPWRETWARLPGDDGLVPLIVPIGDIEDITQLSADQAVNGDAEALKAITARYGAEDVLVTEASVSGDPDSGSATLEMVTRRYKDGVSNVTLRDRVLQVTGEPYDGFLERAAHRIDSAIQESWKQQNVLQFGNQRSILVFVPIDSLDDWLKVRRRLQGVAAIQQTGLTTLTRKEAQLEVTFVGNEQRLTRALAQRDLSLSLRSDSNWELTLADRPAPMSSEQPPAAGGESPAPAPEPQ